jgi:hypothetical protein
MKVGEAIAKLQQLNPDEELIVNVRTSTQAYSVAHCSPFSIDRQGIFIQLPDHMYTGERKKAKARANEFARQNSVK